MIYKTFKGQEINYCLEESKKFTHLIGKIKMASLTVLIKTKKSSFYVVDR